jgi:hypothetical protein
MEIAVLECRHQLQAGGYDEAEKPFTLAYCAVQEPGDWGALGTIQETLCLDRNFLLDTEGDTFLTFRNSRKVWPESTKG